MIKVIDIVFFNFGFIGKGNDFGINVLRDVIEVGVCGLKVYEDWGVMFEVIDRVLSIVDEYDV